MLMAIYLSQINDIINYVKNNKQKDLDESRSFIITYKIY